MVIMGAGPAGLTAGYAAQQQGLRCRLIEKGDRVGGIARTETYNGYRFDIGGHRFYTKVAEVERIWHEVLGAELLSRPRLSRIFYNGKFYQYPLSLSNTLRNLGVGESTRILASYLKWQLFPHRQEESFEQWVTNRFGRRLFRTFFETYTEKVWGIPCHTIRADWAAQRIKGLSLKSAVSQAIFNGNGVKSLITEFYYPRLGPGMMWEAMQTNIEQQGGRVDLNCEVMRLEREDCHLKQIVTRQGEVIAADHFLSSMPLTHLLQRLHPPPPPTVMQAVNSLKYRDFLIVGLIINQADLFPDNWLYIHSPQVQVGRIQNFKNWSAAMVPHPQTTSLGMEYFCSEGDALWEQSDGALLDLARREVAQLGLARSADVVDGVVIRQRKAYPVYDHAYQGHLQIIRDYLSQFDNLQTIGRNGMHRYNNQDHSMLTGLLAVKNIVAGQAEQHDLWQVNTERSYYETFVRQPTQAVNGVAHLSQSAVSRLEQKPTLLDGGEWRD